MQISRQAVICSKHKCNEKKLLPLKTDLSLKKIKNKMYQ